ncbi:hypothetical protein LPTSP3_g22470 [Leptospira kobayashii]|uniref:Lipoprotein n=1 Tax=Leptospira kobayashii TaxID=1917830 RepID=A0ABN6KI37_9LEPT|nr:hypothetical protein [Leptospira kobayashii]BDA79317.1 hypothetical protein LPTSP3_g22470 [Leptospira kobayashii]
MTSLFKFFNLFISLSLGIFFSFCSAGEVEDVDFIGKNKDRYVSTSDANAKALLSEIKSKETNYSSFKGEFAMNIQVFVPKKDNFAVDGKIFYSKETGLVKIQLMDTFFGLVFSELIASPTEIQIKPTSTNKVTTQAMGDLLLQDPNTKKSIQLPFPVIYQYLTGSFQPEITSPKARFLTKENRILLEKKDGVYEYFFEEGELNRIELVSPLRKLKAVSLVKEKDPKSKHPPKSILTKVIPLGEEKENVLILIKMKKVTKTEIPESVFRF